MNRPYVLVNVAMTADGKIDTVARRGAAISSAADKRRVDAMRASVDAILVGGRTLVDENPKLTVKSAELRAERLRKGLPENPAKVGVASVIGMDELLAAGDFLASGPAQVFVYTTARTAPEVRARLEAAGAAVSVAGQERIDLVAILGSLYQRGVRRLIVEGGGTILAELFRLGLVDEITVYIAPKIFAGASAPTLADGSGFSEAEAPRLHLISAEKFDEEGGVLLRYEPEINGDKWE